MNNIITAKGNTGKTDIGYRTIYAGDTLRDRHTGLIFKVDKSGVLAGVGRNDIRKNWKGEDYIIVPTSELAAQAEVIVIDEALTKPEWPEKIVESKTETETETETELESKAKGKRGGRHFPEGSKFVIVDGKRKLVRPGEPTPVPDQVKVAATALSDEDLAKELRRRGYTVSATKQVIVEL